MFDFLGKLNKPWLGNDELLYTLKLQNVSDSFDPSPLWDHRYGGDKGIKESVTGNKTRRLKVALDVHRSGETKEDERGRKIEEKQVFTDVVVWICEKLWDRDSLLGGQKIEMLADNLSHYHNDDFGNELCTFRFPSYIVMPDSSLKPDEVMFQFGKSVFIPQPEEEPLGTIFMQIKGKTPWLPLREWIFWKRGKRFVKQAAIYARQKFLLIGSSTQSASLCCTQTENGQPLWLSHGKGNILINLSNYYDVLVRGDGKFISSGNVIDKNPMETIYSFKAISPIARDDDNHGEELLLKMPDLYPIVNRTRGIGSEDRLVTEGIALPRIGKCPGLYGWTLWIDESGRPVNKRSHKTKYLTFSATAHQEHIQYRQPWDKRFSKLTQLPLSITNSNGLSIEVLKSPIPDIYFGLLLLPCLSFYRLSETQVLGREKSNHLDIKLQQVMNPESLQWERGKEDPDMYFGDIGLSRRHIRVTKQGNKLRIRMEKGSTPVYALDKELQLKATLLPGTSDEIVIQANECFIIGCYLLRFKQG